MKFYLFRYMCFFLPIFSNLCAENLNPKEHAKRQISLIDNMMDTYELEGSTYKLDFNYHLGYLLGQRKAYQDMIDQF